MASSVSSERAFSSAGITITKRRNRLGYDIVEALQVLKAAFRQDLIFRESLRMNDVELETLLNEELEDDDIQPDIDDELNTICFDSDNDDMDE